jgi:tetratricopeptide (TPR) repeat protein
MTARHDVGRITDARRDADDGRAGGHQVIDPDAVHVLPVGDRAGKDERCLSPVRAGLTDLDIAAALGGDRAGLDAERAAIYQALGRYDEALAIRRAAADSHPDFSALAALAGVCGELGEMEEAERWFSAATRCYRATSPFPLAMLEFQRGQLWMEHGNLRRARAWCDAAGFPPTFPRRAT